MEEQNLNQNRTLPAPEELKPEERERVERMLIETNSYSNTIYADRGEFTTGLASHENPTERFLDIPRNAALRERIVEAMRVDLAGAQSLKEVYPNLYQEAQNRDIKMNQIAGLGNIEKIFKGVSYREREKYREEIKAKGRAKKYLETYRKETFAGRKTDYYKLLSTNLNRLEDHKDRMTNTESPEDYAARQAVDQIKCHRELKTFGENGEPDLLHLMRTTALTGKAELRRQTMGAYSRFMVENDPDYQDVQQWDERNKPLFTDGLPLLCEKKDQTTEEGAKRITDMEKSMYLINLNTYAVSEIQGGAKMQKEAFDNSFKLAIESYEALYSGVNVSNCSQLFTGSVHPYTVLFTPVQERDAAVNKRFYESQTFVDLYELMRKSQYTEKLVDYMLKSKYLLHRISEANPNLRDHREANQARDYLIMVKRYTQAMQNYLNDLFDKVKKWETNTPEEGEEELSYRSKSFQEYLAEQEWGAEQ